MSALGALGAHATGVRLDYGRGREAPITALAFDELVIAPGERVGLVGPSGAGKTSLLYVLSGIERPQQGRIRWGDDELAAMGEGMRDRWRLANAGFVFQEFHLIPGMTALQNVLAPVRFARWRPTAAEVAHARTLLAGFGAPDDRRPVERMSRGEQQRVALARALAPRPGVVLLDEPFNALDRSLRAAVRDDVRAALERAGATAVLVTHDQEEALSMADTVAVMRAGRIVQQDTPAAVYTAPADLGVATFVGEAVVLPARATGETASCVLGDLPRRFPGPTGPGHVAVRPEQLALTDAGDAPGTAARGRVERLEYFGHDAALTVLLDTGERLRVRTGGDVRHRPGDRVGVAVRGTVLFFPE